MQLRADRGHRSSASVAMDVRDSWGTLGARSSNGHAGGVAWFSASDHAAPTYGGPRF